MSCGIAPGDNENKSKRLLPGEALKVAVYSSTFSVCLMSYLLQMNECRITQH